MLSLHVNVDDLLTWSRYLNEVPKRNAVSIARAMNALGDGIVRNMAQDLSDQTGVGYQDAIGMFQVTEASETSLRWAVDAEQALAEGETARPMGGRNWGKRDTSNFKEGQLVNIITLGDEKVCEICERAAEEGPYELEEARAMLPLHPNCRCVLWEARMYRRVPVRFSSDIGARMPQQTIPLTIEQIAKVLETSFEIFSK